MIGGALLVLVGLTGSGWAVRAATAGSRPLDLVGAVVAPIAVAVALAGVLAMALPGFFA